MALTETDWSALEQAVLDFDDKFFQGEAKESLAWQLGALVSNGKFLEAVSFEKSPLTLILTQLKSEVDGKGIDAHDVVLKLRDLIEDYLTMGTATAEKHLALVYAAIASLMIFVQGNFTGPPFEGEIAVSPVRPYLSFLNPFFPQTPFLKHLKLDFMLTILNIHGITDKDASTELAVDGESAYKKALYLPYLLLARVVLQDNATYIKHCKSVSWWTARFGFKLQSVMSGPSETLRNFVNAQYQKSLFAYASRPEILLELGLVYHFYKDSQRAREFFLKAKAASKLYSELSGMKGRRTKYQTFDTAQLVLFAQSYDPAIDMPEENAEVALTPSHYVDKDSLEAYFGTEEKASPNAASSSIANAVAEKLMPVELEADEEDIRLRAPSLVAEEGEDAKIRLADQNLKVIDQCILLGLCLDVRNENPRHGLTAEQMKAYVERVMKHPNNWTVHSMALLIKSRLEANSSKYNDRAAMQLQALADQFKDGETREEYPALVRAQRAFQVLYPPFHRLKWEIGDLYLRLGAARSALLIFEELELWTEAISALQLLEEPERAKALISERFTLDGETPELLCLMGDVSEEMDEKIAQYTKCWEKSRGRYPRAKRQLAKLAMDRKDWPLAMKHYREALAVNPQYGFAWFRLGCCAIEMLDWAQAQVAFTRVTYLHPDDAEAWSNLAAACMKLNKLKEAHSAFKEALKHNQENWRIWDNYMVTCVKLGHIQESIYCLHKLLDLNSSIDAEVLEILVNIATVRYPAPTGGDLTTASSETNYIHKQLRALFAKILAQVSNASNPDVWGIFAKYYAASAEHEQVIEYRQKQVKALQVHGYESDAEKFAKVVTALELLVTELELAQDAKTAYSAKLAMKSMLKKAQDAFDGTPTFETVQNLIPRLEAIKAAPATQESK